MPRFDRTGPEGKGPKTGRGLGDCSEETNSADLQRQFFGRRLGLGRRRRNRRRIIRNNPEHDLKLLLYARVMEWHTY